MCQNLVILVYSSVQVEAFDVTVYKWRCVLVHVSSVFLFSDTVGYARDAKYHLSDSGSSKEPRSKGIKAVVVNISFLSRLKSPQPSTVARKWKIS